MAKYHEEIIGSARVSCYPDNRHESFWKDPERIDSELRTFVNEDSE